MSHVRTQIAESIAGKLSAISVQAGPIIQDVHVYVNRYHPFSSSELPAIVIFFDSEEVISRSMGSLDPDQPRNTERLAVFAIQVTVKADDDFLFEMLDEINVKIEKILATNRFLDGLTQDLRLSTTRMNIEGDGELPAGMTSMNWEAEYWCLETNPEEA